jgi:hypothetical protein
VVRTCNCRPSCIQLYDPGRSHQARGPMSHTHAADAHDDHGHGAHAEVDVWAEFDKWKQEADKDLVNVKQGEGLHVLMPPTSSPSLLGAVARMKAGSFPKARFHTWTALHSDNELAGAQMAFGRALATHHDFTKADVVLSLDSDFLANDGNNLRNARPVGREPPRASLKDPARSSRASTWSSRPTRRPAPPPTIASAPERRDPSGRLRARQGARCRRRQRSRGEALAGHARRVRQERQEVGRDPRQGPAGRARPLARDRRPAPAAAVHAIVHAINQALGNRADRDLHGDARRTRPAKCLARSRNCRGARAGTCTTLVCLGTNPVYDAPADLKFADLLRAKKPKRRRSTSAHEDETAAAVRLALPARARARELGRRLRLTTAPSRCSSRWSHRCTAASARWSSSAEPQRGRNPTPNLVTGRDTTFGYELVKRALAGQGAGTPTSPRNWWPKALHDGLVGQATASSPPRPRHARRRRRSRPP